MGMADTLMMLGVLGVGGYVAIKVLPQLNLGQAFGAPAPVVYQQPVAPSPVCGMVKCDDSGSNTSCQCTGQAAFAMSSARDCDDCKTECEGRCSGNVGTAPDIDDDDDDDDDDDNDNDSPKLPDSRSKQGVKYAPAICQSEGGRWQGSCCSCPNSSCKNKCRAGYARRYSLYGRPRTYRTIAMAQTINRMRRARMAQAYYNMNYDPGRII